MKIKILNHEVELTRKINIFIPSSELCTAQCKEIEKDLIHSGLKRLQTFYDQHPVRRKWSFSNSQVNKETLRDPETFKYILTIDPLLLLWIEDEYSIWKISEEFIENLDYIEVSNLTPNTILTSPIFDFEELISESHLENERLRTEETYQQVKINDETKEFLKEIAKNLKEKNGK